MCSSRTASARRNIAIGQPEFLRVNSSMLAHQVRQSMMLAAAVVVLTFTRDIAPIVWSRCAPCHRPGEIGPFSLVTYDDVKRHATQIAAVTARRAMPPWKPSPADPRVGEFEGGRRLSDRELDMIQKWIAAGAVEGDARDLPPQPAWDSGWRLGVPDLVVTMPTPYDVAASGADVFRSFVLPIPTTRPRYVSAIDFRPGNARVVHHASMGVDRTRSSRLLDERDPEPGYTGGMVSDAQYPEGQLLGWTPGQAPHAVPPGGAWRLEPNSDLVVQLHLQPTGRREAVQVSVGFYFTDEAPTRTPIGLRLGTETIDIAAGDREYVVSDRYSVPVDVDVIAIQPHAHNLARRMEATATLPDGTTLPLITIADWDFRWQDVYRYASPVALPKGSTIAMRYTYDNSDANPRNPHHPPSRVVWGQNTSDEMGDLWVQLIAARQADAAPLGADVQRKRSAEDLAAYSKLLAADPDNPLRHDAVGLLHLQSERLEEAIEQFKASLRLNPQSASTHYNLGYALALRGRRDEAMAEMREALRIDPDYAQAHNNLGAMLQAGGRLAEAEDHFRRAIALRPDNIEARANLGQLLSARRQERGAVEQFRAVLAQRDDYAQALSGLAWIEATTQDASLRNPEDAVRLAERAAAITRRQDVAVLDALAAAYAAVERFEDAVVTAVAGAALADSQGLSVVAARFREREAVYRAHRRD